MLGVNHWPYLLILLVIVLIIWGPGKLPELGSGMGKAIREFRKASTEVKDSFNQATAEPAPQAQAPVQMVPAPAPTVPQPQPVAPAAPAAPAGNGEQQPTV
jgi:TatA/E family protein of Tat protein translocase